MKTVIRTLAVLSIALFGALFFLSASITVKATNQDGNNNNGVSDTGVHSDFNYISAGNSAQSKAEKAVLGIGATVYQMLLKIGIFGVVISLMVCGISFLVKGNDSKERSELKMWLFRIGIVLIVMTSLTSIAGLIGGLLSGIF